MRPLGVPRPRSRRRGGGGGCRRSASPPRGARYPAERGSALDPGGHVELGEEPEAGAVRELEEETGLVADAADLVLVDARNLTPLGDEASEEVKEVVCLDYAVDAAVVEGEPTAADDLTGVQWVGVEERGEVPWAFSGYEEFVVEAVDAVGDADSADH